MTLQNPDPNGTFLARVWRVAFEEQQDGSHAVSPKIQDVECADKELKRIVHETIAGRTTAWVPKVQK